VKELKKECESFQEKALQLDYHSESLKSQLDSIKRRVENYGFILFFKDF